MSKTKSTLIKSALFTVPILLIALIVYLVFKSFLPDFIPVIQSGEEAEIEAYIRSQGSLLGALIAALLQFFQVVSVIFPGMPIQIAAGIIFGWFKGFLICEISYVAANVIILLISRAYSMKIKSFLTFEKNESKLTKFVGSDYPEFMVFLGCMMPLLPNGIIPYVAAKTNVTLPRFTAAVTLGSSPTVLLLCLLGNSILSGNYLFSLFLFVVLGVAIVVMYVFRDRLIELARKIKQN